MKAQPAEPRLPSVAGRVVGQPVHLTPYVATVLALEERRRLDPRVHYAGLTLPTRFDMPYPASVRFLSASNFGASLPACQAAQVVAPPYL